ncbi:MAG: M48 family metallopeptidase [Chitinophagales bacterium]
MKKQIIFISAILFNYITLFAQQTDFDHFQSLRAKGPVPEDFTKLSSEKFREDRETMESSSQREAADKETFLLESNFLMDEILHSGRVIFGDPVSVYLNQMKDILLKDEPELRDRIRVYTLLSNEVNAFTADNGIVLVTTGLISQVENEAQIAFILCHEFNHFIKKHAITSYIENRKIERGSGAYRSLGNSDIDLEKFRYSKELETEADQLGLTLFNKSAYSVEAAQGVFDVLLYSYLPFDEVEFDTTYFNEGYYALPGEYFLDSLNAISAEEDYDDAESTHPNIKKRREAMFIAIKNVNDDNRNAFILPEEEFHHIQKLCRYEGCELFLNNLEYEDAFYQAYLLQQTDTSNIYLKRVMAESLYALSIYHTAGNLPENHRYYKKIEGNSEQVFYFFYKIKDPELNTLALKYTWEAHLADPSNTQLSAMCQQLASDLQIKNETSIKSFYNAKQAEGAMAKNKMIKLDTIEIEEDAVVIEEPKTKSKYQKIKEETKTKPVEGKSDKPDTYWRYAFVDYMEDPQFTELMASTDETETESEEEKNKIKEEYQLGLNKIVFVNPLYVSIDERNEKVEYEKAETNRIELKDKIFLNASLLKLDVEYIDHNSIEQGEAEKFNDLSLLNRWIAEKLDHMENEVDIINLTNDELKELSGKYDAENFAWMGIMAFREKERNIGSKIMLCLIYPLAPILIVDMIKPNFTTFFFTLVVNSKTGEIEMQYFNDTKINDSASVQNSNIYYILQQIKTPPSK